MTALKLFPTRTPEEPVLSIMETSLEADQDLSAPKARTPRRTSPRLVLLRRAAEMAGAGLIGLALVVLLLALLTPLPRVGEGLSASQTAADPASDLSIFGRFDPFSPRGVPAAAPVTVVAGETSLNLKLVGVYLEGQPSALIQSNRGSQDPYFVGDDIAPGVTIEDIYTDQVLLRRNGVNETLSMEGRDPAALREQRVAATATPVAAAPQNRPTGPQTPAQPSTDAVEVEEDAASLLARLENLAGGASSAAATQQLDVSDIVQAEYSAEQGLILFPGPDGVGFFAAGFEAGDRIIAVDGKDIRPGPENLFSVIQSLTQGPVTVTVERDGYAQDVTFDPAGL